jgi:tetratricopeptide (TPR) repeat protein
MVNRVNRLCPGTLMAAALLLSACAAPSPTPVQDDLLALTRARLASARAQLENANELTDRADLMLKVGHHDEARALVHELTAGDLAARLLAGRILGAVHDFERLGPLVDELHRAHPDDPDVRDLAYRWWFITDDAERLDRVLQTRSANDEMTVIDHLAAAVLRLRLLEVDAAVTGYRNILDMELRPQDRARALRGLGVSLHAAMQFDESLGRLTEALEISPIDADTLSAIADTLIRLARTDEAIDALTMAVKVAPYHQRSHQMLGSGYALLSYTQLFADHSDRFADENERGTLERGDGLLRLRRVDEARKLYQDVREAHPDWADAEVRLGSLEYAERNFAAARDHFTRALTVCPEYGRAHAGLARALAAQHNAVLIHREMYEDRLSRALVPEIPGIEDFVINWDGLSARHQKRLALSVGPWKRYLPVLIEAGATFYIKPLHELLSETPHQETLRDQRISYDSRLWDDVRGVGGFHAVSGIEDIESLIPNGYDTVLHEMSHQVHATLAEDWKREIQECYAEAKRRDASTGDAFLSRYASGSVWEYFAEGVNSFHNPRRDRFDTREIVRERLEDRDQPLEALVRKTVYEADVEPSYAAAFVNNGSEQLRRGRPEKALEWYHRALTRSPDSEAALAAMIHALAVMGNTDDALEAASGASRTAPRSATIALGQANARWLAGEGLPAAIRTLEEARPRVRESEVYLIDGELGALHWIAGDAEASLQAYRSVLEYQADSPTGLWGAAGAEALAGRWEQAWDLYQSAVRLRTGVVELRTAYARDLMGAGELERAAEQLDAALLLDPNDPEAVACNALRHLENGDLDEARRQARRARSLGPWCDLAVVVEAAAERSAGNASFAENILKPLRDRIRRGDPPEYVYRKKWGRYDRVHTLPFVLRSLLPP